MLMLDTSWAVLKNLLNLLTNTVYSGLHKKKHNFWDSFLFLYTAILFFVALDRTHISSETLHKYTEHLYILTKNKIVISFEIPKYHFQFIFSKSEDKCVYRCRWVLWYPLPLTLFSSKKSSKEVRGYLNNDPLVCLSVLAKPCPIKHA
jgi:hypothetical protein